MMAEKSIKIAARLRLGLEALGLFSTVELMLQGSDTRRYREQPRALVGQDFICFHSHTSPFFLVSYLLPGQEGISCCLLHSILQHP